MKNNLKNFSYYKTGGTCNRIFRPSSINELQENLKEIKKYFILGAGANSLIMDSHWDGDVIILSNLNTIKLYEDHIYIECGANNTDISLKAAEQSFSNLSWLYFLPGQLGGTIRMNARCYGGEISRETLKVTSLNKKRGLISRKPHHVYKGYKSTIFMDNDEIIVSAELCLKKGDKNDIFKKMESYKKDRVDSHQFDYPSCGCVFKNDHSLGVTSGRLLEKAGAKGLTHGGAKVSSYHANFIFNVSASSRDILELSLKMRDLVYSAFGVWMDFEMVILGSVPDDLQERLKEIKQFDVEKFNEQKSRLL